MFENKVTDSLTYFNIKQPNNCILIVQILKISTNICKNAHEYTSEQAKLKLLKHLFVFRF